MCIRLKPKSGINCFIYVARKSGCKDDKGNGSIWHSNADRKSEIQSGFAVMIYGRVLKIYPFN
jgi:hypothetical protein